MRRFVTLVFLLLFTIPFGISISGCGKKTAITYCEGSSGPIVGQATTVTLTPKIFGISMNFSQIGQVSAPSATDCKGTAVTISSYTYGIFDANGKANMTIADVVPTTGRLCAGTWNRNSGGGIADYTTCNPTNQAGTVYVVATGNGANSNPLPIFVHPVVTSVVLGNATPTANCSTDPDPSSNCCPIAADATVTAPAYSPNSCLSQGQTGQLVARAYNGTTNITCQVGHLSYSAQTGAVVNIDENGVATAQKPGSSVISATISQASSSAGFFSTCPPVSIALSIPNTQPPATSVVVNQNNLQPINTVVLDKNGTILTGLSLEFVSTTPSTIPAASTGSVTPSFPGAAQITAICQPPSCNPSSFNQIGLLGNGLPVTSNPITVTTPGNNSTLLYIASTQSRYIMPVDFTTYTPGQPPPPAVKLPYVPNSMVISNDGSNIYMGSATELMVFSTSTSALSKQDTTVPGQVLAVSPDGTTLVITDPVRQLIYLYSTTGGSLSGPSQGGVGTHAQFSPDSQTVYITTTNANQILVHSTFTGWTTVNTPGTDVAVTVPSVGAYLAGSSTNGVSYCPSTTTSSDGLTVLNNAFYPVADTGAPAIDRIAATNDGHHILGATTANIVDLGFGAGLPIGACPSVISPTFFTPYRTATSTAPLSGIAATAINGVIPTSDSSLAIVTYTGTGGMLPTYAPSATGAGSPTNVPLQQVPGRAAPVAPVSGVISSDNSTIYVGTTGDNSIHLINRTTLTDDPTKTIAPNLQQNINGVDQPGTIVSPDLLVQHPKKLQS
jgi:trimeric autotransporter adhesin